MASNLIAYIPTLNPRHVEWFKRHPDSNLFLISNEDAERLLPRLARDMSALPTELIARTINREGWTEHTCVFNPLYMAEVDPRVPLWSDWILPDEDVSHFFAEKYLIPEGCNVSYEMIWARWDMTAVIQSQPVLPDVQISHSDFDRHIIEEAQILAVKSSDWWRQIAAAAVSKGGQVVASAFNLHLPNEYETYIFGDPGLNRDAGQEGKYTSAHAEEGVIAYCAKHGISLNGASVYVTTFPCEKCARLIGLAGVSKLFFGEGYSALNALDVLRSFNIEIIQVKSPVSA